MAEFAETKELKIYLFISANRERGAKSKLQEILYLFTVLWEEKWSGESSKTQ